MSEILVTGGNGFVGRHIVSALQDRGDSVRALVLPTEDARWLQARGVAVHRGDVRQPATLVAPMQGAHGVLHLAAMMDVWRPLADYRAVNVAGTENVCRAALAADVRRFVHMSSSSVYGVALGRPADESWPLAPFPDPYPVTKAEGDRLVQRMVRDHHLPAVIVRPDQIFGPGDHLHFGRTAERIQARRAIVVGAGTNSLPLVYIGDLVQGLLLALDHERAAGQIYNITTDCPLTQEEFLAAIAEEVGAPPPRVHVPYPLLYIAGYAGERLAELTRSRRRPPVTRLGVAFLGTDNTYAMEKARRELGYSPQVALREGVRLTADWHRQRSHQHPVPAQPPVPSAEEISV